MKNQETEDYFLGKIGLIERPPNSEELIKRWL